MDNSSELRDLKEYVDSLDRDEDRRVYDATIVSVLMLQHREKPDVAIEKRFGIKLRDEHRRMVTLGSPADLELRLTWDEVPTIGVPSNGVNIGRVAITVKNTSVGPEALLWECNSIDLLQWLAEHWASLVLSEAGANGSMSANDNIDEDERALHNHNLAEAFSRTTIDSFSLCKAGNLMQVTLGDADTLLVAFDAVESALAQLGDVVASRLMWLSDIGASSTEVDGLVARWRDRNTLPVARVIELASERTANDVVGRWLTCHIVPTGPDPAALVNVRNIGDQPRRLLAAARMMGSLDSEEMLEILSDLEKLRFDPLEREIHAVSNRALKEYEQYNPVQGPDKKPVRLGHHLAQWLRTDIGLEDREPGDPDGLLERWKVRVIEAAWRTKRIDAIACWQKNSQPVIFLNRNGLHSESKGGRRASLAHEICHILVDRSRYFPVVEVLGGALPKSVEQIARGFQAEFLIPRSTAQSIVTESASIQDALKAITEDFDVSQQLAANQILNAGCSLTHEERNFLKRIAQR